VVESTETDPESEVLTDPDEELEEPQPAGRLSPSTRSMLEWFGVIVGALLVALFARATVVQAFYIPSGSMLPTLEIGDRVLVNRLSYKLHDIHRGDIVVFERPQGTEDGSGIKDLIKRVVGLPGETIEARDGKVYIDGKLLEEGYLPDGTPTTDLPATEIPPDHIFVMGDNRTGSNDSRRFGPVPEDSVIGRAFVRIWPVRKIGTM
jgi:signal peptidase I